LHVDSFIWHRAFGYDLRRRHEPWLRGCLLDQVDFPRAFEAGLCGATWVITTNPLRDGKDRFTTLLANLTELCGLFAELPDRLRLVRNFAEYRAARASGLHAAFIGIQGGNALDLNLETFERLPAELLIRITLVHLYSSKIGATSSPLKLGGDYGLTPFGHEFVRRMNEKRILVDLAHISRRGFSEAVRAHDPTLPLIVTHTGVSGVHPHWRNLDDAQLRMIAASGGTVGIMYHAPFLGDRLWRGRAESVVRHLEHVVRTVGDEFASLGSDWDGAIVTPRDMPTCLELPRLVQLMLDRGWQAERIRRILGENFLRVVRAVRG
jgi:membrane dipeptidase